MPSASEISAAAYLARHARHPCFAAVLEAWLAARGDAPMPQRRALDPINFWKHVTHTWLYERQPDGLYVCRLAGEAIIEGLGTRLKDRDIETLFGKPRAAVIRARWDFCLDRPALFHADAETTQSGTKRAERLVLPVSDAEGTPRFVFGASVYDFDRRTEAGWAVGVAQSVHAFCAQTLGPIDPPA